VALGNKVTGQMRFISYGLDEKNVRAIYLEGDEICLGGVGTGSQAKGVTKYNRLLDTWEYWEPVSSFNFYTADVQAIVGDGENIWLGTKSGLVRYSKKEQQFRTYTRSWGLWENEITALKFGGHRLWVGTPRGLNVKEAGSDSLIKVELPGINRIYIRTIEVDSQTVWVGTDQGIYKLDLVEKTREKFIDPYGMVNTRVNHIVKSGDELWFASRLGILEYNPKENEYKVYHQGVDIPGGEVLQIAVHPPALWAATTNGAAKLDRNTNIWRHYTEFDGLLDNYVETLVLEKDYIWLGTPEGLTRFRWNVPGRIE
jgi:ligand-binding sensor domain-containing protein